MNDATLQRRYDAAVQADLTYDHVGSTIGGGTGRDRVIGHGPESFARASAGLRTWAAHRAIGAKVFPADSPIEEGRTVLVALGVGPLRLIAPTRIVVVINEPTRFGFAYGTLPGHPESGEESFMIEHCDDGSVVARIRVDAKPATLLTRVAGPVGRGLQQLAMLGYLRGLARAG